MLSIKNFDGLKVLLRFEVDACTGTKSTGASVDDLAAALADLGVAPKASAVATGQKSKFGLSIIRTTPRTIVDQSSLIEMKTRASHKALDWDEAFPQLYLSQTPYLYLAKHSRGEFIAVEKVALGGDGMRVHAQRARAGLAKLRAVLTEVLNAVREAGSGVELCLVCVDGKLTLRKRKEGTGKTVGKEILGRFV
jgi:hypothetical protein